MNSHIFFWDTFELNKIDGASWPKQRLICGSIQKKQVDLYTLFYLLSRWNNMAGTPMFRAFPDDFQFGRDFRCFSWASFWYAGGQFERQLENHQQNEQALKHSHESIQNL